MSNPDSAPTPERPDSAAKGPFADQSPVQPDAQPYNKPYGQPYGQAAAPAYGQPYGQTPETGPVYGQTPQAGPAAGAPVGNPYTADEPPQQSQQYEVPQYAGAQYTASTPAPANTPVAPFAPEYAATSGYGGAPQPQYDAEPPLDQPYYGCSLPQAFLRFWKKYATFSGRASRSEYWWWTLCAALITLVLGLFEFLLMYFVNESAGSIASLLSSGWSIAVFVPSLALAVRRLHDTNRSGGWLGLYYGVYVLSIVIAVIGLIVAVVGGLFQSGSNATINDSTVIVGLVLIGVGAIAMLAICILFIVFYAQPSKPEGARFDKRPAFAPAAMAPVPPANGYPGYYGAAPNNAPYGAPYGTPAPGYGYEPATPYGAVPAPAEPTTPAETTPQASAKLGASTANPYTAPVSSTGAETPANAEDGSTVLSPHAPDAPTDDNGQKPWQSQ